MQNPPVANALPAVQAPVSSGQGSAAGQPAETFGSVLARQQTAAEEPADNVQAASAHAARATGDSEITGPIPKETQDTTDETLAVEVLAALLPDAGSIHRATGSGDNTGGLPTPAPGAGDTPPAAAPPVQLPVSATALPYTAPFAQDASVTPGAVLPSPQPPRAGDDGAALSGRFPANALPPTTLQVGQEAAVFDTVLPAQLPGGAQALASPAQPDASALPALSTLPQYSAAPPSPGLAGAAQLRMNTPLTDRSWGEDLGQKIVWMVASGAQTAELHLNPPLLGPLDVVISVSGDQAAALFASPHASVRLAVEQALPKLREMLADNGITLGNATVGDQLPENRQSGPEYGRQNRGSWPVAGGTFPAGAPQNGLAVLPGRRHEGMVDTFA